MGFIPYPYQIQTLFFAMVIIFMIKLAINWLEYFFSKKKKNGIVFRLIFGGKKMICTLNCWFLESQMAQNKFSSWVKMLVNPLKPNVFNTHLPKMLNLWAKFYEFVLYYSMSTNPNLAFGKYFIVPHKKRER